MIVSAFILCELSVCVCSPNRRRAYVLADIVSKCYECLVCTNDTVIMTVRCDAIRISNVMNDGLICWVFCWNFHLFGGLVCSVNYKRATCFLTRAWSGLDLDSISNTSWAEWRQTGRNQGCGYWERSEQMMLSNSFANINWLEVRTRRLLQQQYIPANLFI